MAPLSSRISGTKMNETVRKAKKIRLYLLVLTLVFELVLFECLNSLGWFGTGNAFLIAVAVLFMATPLLVGLFLFSRSRFRFGMRTLLASCALMALFLWMTVMPIVHYNRERVGVRFLFQNRIALDQSRYQDAGIPIWLLPIYGSERPITDNSLDFVMLASDYEVDAFCQVADRFPNLSSVLTYKVSEASYRKLNQTLKRLPSLRQLDIGDSEPTNTIFDSLDSLKAMVFRETLGVQRPFKDELFRDIVKQPQLETLDIQEFDLEANDLSILLQATTLKIVRFYRCRLTDEKVEALRLSMPQTEFIVARPTPTVW